MAMQELREPPYRRVAICLIGIDGAGKTTHSLKLIDHLHRLGINCKYIWFGKASFFSYPFMAVCRMLSLTATHHIENGTAVSEHKYYRNKAISRVWPWVQFLDVLVSVKRARIKLWLSRGFTVVCDRSILDILVELMTDVNDKNLHKRLLGRLMLKLMPHPLVLMCLDVNERIAWRRKDDVPKMEYLSRRRSVYRLVTRDLGIPTVDAEGSIVSVQRRVIALIDELDKKSIAQQLPVRANYAPRTDETGKSLSSGVRTKQHLSFSAVLENWQAECISFLRKSFHLVFFRLYSPVSPFEKGMLIISVDVDVGSKEIGVINKGKNDHNVSHLLSEYEIGELEEATVPEFLKLLDAYKVPATFAIRGQLAEVPDSALAILLKSSAKHDIAAHGYYHRRFQSLSHDEAEVEIKMILHGMQKLELTPKSFVFPCNSVSHLKLLEEYGYECYRDHGGFVHDSMRIERHGTLWDVHPSLLIDKYARSIFLRKILDVAIKRRLPMHLWFHMRDFGKEPGEIKRNMERVFIPLLGYADSKVRDGVLTLETMLSAARKARAIEMCSSNSKPD